MIIFIEIIFMDDNFSPRVKDVITFSKEEALRLGHDFIGTEHLVLGMIRNGEGKAIDILNFLGIDLNEINLRFAAGIYIFEKYDGKLTVEEIREMIEDETDKLII